MNEAHIVIQCDDLDAAIGAYTSELGFRLDMIFPADAPRVVELSGFGIRLRLERRASTGSAQPASAQREPSLVVTKLTDGGFGSGRAGMQYRDLIPDRFGGRFIASHIRIAEGGPVPDYVHHHHIDFQMIFCVHGWVRVAYEDQGEPMLMQAGDCFLQPPHIRHRVLECSDAMEVVEFASPAEHETFVEHDIDLPTGEISPDRDFGGQRFVFHRAADADWRAWDTDGYRVRDTGIAAATNDVASAVVVRAHDQPASVSLDHDAGIRFLFVLSGQATLDGGERTPLETGDACAIPPASNYSLTDVSADFKFLQVVVPNR